jgi:hypothetical protein
MAIISVVKTHTRYKLHNKLHTWHVDHKMMWISHVGSNYLLPPSLFVVSIYHKQ